MTGKVALACGASGAVAMAAGALGPWATWLGGWGSASGLDRGDGWWVLGAAILALVALTATVALNRAAARPSAPGAALAASLAAALGVYGVAVFLTNWRDFEDMKSENAIVAALSDLDVINTGWGIYAVGAGSLVLLVAAAWLAAKSWLGSGNGTASAARER